MHKPSVQWVLAIVLTLVSVVWQRTTGPTYPARGHVRLGGHDIPVTLERSYSITGRQPVIVAAPDAAVTGTVRWRRFPSRDAWRDEPMVRQGDVLEARLPPAPLPLMPPAGKLEFRVRLARGAETTAFPDRPVVSRFKGDVPAWILVPHIVAMFFGMLCSNRAAFAAVWGGPTRTVALVTVALLVFGGLVLGPVVQKLAFGAYWTGIPWGYDLTDNKTLIAGVVWIAAAWRLRRDRPARALVALAAVVTLVVFAIPHSVWGSEVKW
jgi:hypothetical protein